MAYLLCVWFISVSYNDGNILLRWSNETSSPVLVDYDISLPQFQIKDIDTDEFSKPRRGSGNILFVPTPVMFLSLCCI